jgi:phospholipid/cholesterol/gamma-HCH transport system permease protein
VSPRIIAATIATPLLCGIFDFVAMVGSYIVCVRMLGIDEAIFLDKIGLWLEPRHINEGLVKSAVFGLIFSVVCTYKGFYTEGGAKGVGEATNQGVVLSMVTIIILDYYLTSLIRYYYQLTGG